MEANENMEANEAKGGFSLPLEGVCSPNVCVVTRGVESRLVQHVQAKLPPWEELPHIVPILEPAHDVEVPTTPGKVHHITHHRLQ